MQNKGYLLTYLLTYLSIRNFDNNNNNNNNRIYIAPYDCNLKGTGSTDFLTVECGSPLQVSK